MFETFDVLALYMATQQVLALYSAGRTTGLVIDTGDGVSHAVPVYDGYSLPRAIVRLELAGRHVTDHLGSLLKHQGYSFTATDELEILHKERTILLCCYRLWAWTQNCWFQHNKLWTSCVDVGSERFQAPECLFKPSLIGKPDMLGIHKITVNAIRKCGVELLADLFRDIVLTRGSSLFSGMEKRMEKEIQSLEVSVRVRVSATSERQLASWIGGSILTSLTSSSKDMLISKEEYNETGPTIVHLKCFHWPNFAFISLYQPLSFFSAVLNTRRGKGWQVNWVAEIKNCSWQCFWRYNEVKVNVHSIWATWFDICWYLELSK